MNRVPRFHGTNENGHNHLLYITITMVGASPAACPRQRPLVACSRVDKYAVNEPRLYVTTATVYVPPPACEDMHSNLMYWDTAVSDGVPGSLSAQKCLKGRTRMIPVRKG